MKLLEKHIQSMILDFLNSLPRTFAFTIYNGGIFDIKAKKFRNHARGRPKGIPDIIGITYGIPFGIEVKAEKGRVSPEQQQMHVHMKGLDWDVRVCRSVEDARAFMASLQALFNCK